MAQSVGRPLKFKSVEELQSKIDSFFKHCDKKKEPYTITGLALHLDTTRETLLDYQAKDEYSDTIKKGKLRCQNYAERMLYKIRAAGPIFALKNFGWRDENTMNLIAPKPLLDALHDNNSDKEDSEPEKKD